LFDTVFENMKQILAKAADSLSGSIGDRSVQHDDGCINADDVIIRLSSGGQIFGKEEKR